MIDWPEIYRFLEYAANAYEKTAPTVHAHVSDLYDRLQAGGRDVSVLELDRTLKALGVDSGLAVQANMAANAIYKLQAELGRDTTGQAGF